MKKWTNKKYFHAEVDRSKKPFTIVMPPPNVTGQLHMGHALDSTMQDILIRFKRMQGYNALWQPGTDHAAIATEVKVTEKLKEEGIDKKELGREGFLKKAWEWKEEYGGRINNQLKKMGASADWDRERFTMDEGCSKAVEEVFSAIFMKKAIFIKVQELSTGVRYAKHRFPMPKLSMKSRQDISGTLNTRLSARKVLLKLRPHVRRQCLAILPLRLNPEDERYKHLVERCWNCR